MNDRTSKRMRASGDTVERRVCADCPARDHGFCGRLPEPLRSKFRNAAEPISLRCSPGEGGQTFGDWDLAVVSRGTLSIRNTFGDGRQALADYLFPGEVVHASAGTEKTGTEVSSSWDFRVCLVQNLDNAFDAKDCHCLERYIRTDAVSHIEALRDKVAVLSRLGPKERLSYLLLDLQTRMNPEESTVSLPFSRSDIADMLGMRTETVSRAMHDLESAGHIRRQGPKTIHILNRDGLESLASG